MGYNLVIRQKNWIIRSTNFILFEKATFTDLIMDKRSNILLIVLDTQRADRLSCYDYTLKTTPQLDQLALRSALFKRAIAPAQWTVPTHASIFSGLSPSQHTMLQMNSVLPVKIPTLAERLRTKGFKTIGISNNPLIGTMGNGLERGFSSMKNYNFWGSGLLNFQLNREGTSHRDVKLLKDRAKFFAAEALGYSDKTFIHRLNAVAPFVWEAFLALREKTKFDVTRQSLLDASQWFLEGQAAHSSPIFMFINLMGTHVPYAPPRWVVNKIAGKDINRKQFYRLRRRVNQIQVNVNNWVDCASLPQSDIEMLNIFYDAEVFTQDLLLGEFFSRLQSGGKLDETFIVIVGDHGDHLGEKRRVNHAFGVYEELVHVPLIIQDPQGVLMPGSTYESLVSTTQLFNTILDAAGIASPDESVSSLLRINQSMIVGDDRFKAVFAQGFPLDWALSRLEENQHDFGKFSLPHFAAYEEGFKLISAGDETDLFHLDKDQVENNDMSLQYPEVVLRLKEALDRFISESVPVAEDAKLDYQDSIIVDHLRALGYLE